MCVLIHHMIFINGFLLRNLYTFYSSDHMIALNSVSTLVHFDISFDYLKHEANDKFTHDKLYKVKFDN